MQESRPSPSSNRRDQVRISTTEPGSGSTHHATDMQSSNVRPAEYQQPRSAIPSSREYSYSASPPRHEPRYPTPPAILPSDGYRLRPLEPRSSDPSHYALRRVDQSILRDSNQYQASSSWNAPYEESLSTLSIQDDGLPTPPYENHYTTSSNPTTTNYFSVPISHASSSVSHSRTPRTVPHHDHSQPIEPIYSENAPRHDSGGHRSSRRSHTTSDTSGGGSSGRSHAATHGSSSSSGGGGSSSSSGRHHRHRTESSRQ
jgi:hypothetical protein